jgi:hypothetical protein
MSSTIQSSQDMTRTEQGRQELAMKVCGRDAVVAGSSNVDQQGEKLR